MSALVAAASLWNRLAAVGPGAAEPHSLKTGSLLSVPMNDIYIYMYT